jgi:type II secretion system protein G
VSEEVVFVPSFRFALSKESGFRTLLRGRSIRKNRFAKTNLKGFTLIELLIVIAIILILIAIALPNFLEAQIRARVTKAKGEIRSLAIAMDSYFLDFKAYPAETEGDFGRPRGEFGHAWLTSPIAYIAQVPEDPFGGRSQNGELRTYESGGIERGIFPCPGCLETWVIYSLGPSENPEPALRSGDPHFSTASSNRVVTYSSTNGTRSEGVIHWYGGDSFWIGVGLSNANKGQYSSSNPKPDTGLIVDNLFYLHRLPPHLM